MELNGKTILISGASSGIGEAAARLFAREGANVVLGARRSEELARVVASIEKSGGRAEMLAGDVRDAAYAEALVTCAEDSFGGLDGAFNNAGTVGDLAGVPDMDPATWQDVIDTNLTASFLVARAQIPALRRRGGGAMVFTSSFVGFSNAGMAGMGAYGAAKAGVVALVKSLAVEHAAEGIRANALLPGGTRTAMAGDDPGVHAMIAALHPLGRLAEPDDIAQAAMFLLSDRASFITGAPVLADGGVSVRFG